MKKSVLSVVLTVVFGAFATATTPLNKDKKQVKAGESVITWKAYKVTGSHTGTITLKEGALLFQDDQLTGGEFIVDMTTINTTDLKAGEGKEKLDGHLHSDDFFGTANHTESKLVFTTVKAISKNKYEVTGDLTIKGKTAPVNFNVTIYGNKATATLKVDRTKYDIKYGSGTFFDNLGDKVIYDDFDLVADLQF